MTDQPTTQKLDGQPSSEMSRTDWWGYRVAIAGRTPFDFWVRGADYADLGDGYIQREACDERLGDGRDPHVCDDPHPDDYYDAVWDVVIDDLHASGHPSLA